MTRAQHDEDAQVGIGTMIVFIATVLVAAVAAGVLIDMSGKLQERSSRTGNEATTQVASNLEVTTVHGIRNTTSDAGLKSMDIYLQLSPGALSIDLGQMKIQILNESSIVNLDYSPGVGGAGWFNATALRDADASFSPSTPSMTTGDLVKVVINLEANSMEFEPRANVRVNLIPEVGHAVQMGFRTPNSYGQYLLIELA